jgi:hypothetical protein
VILQLLSAIDYARLPVKQKMTGGITMLMWETLPFVTAFVEELDKAVRYLDPEAGLTRKQADEKTKSLVRVLSGGDPGDQFSMLEAI